MLNSNHLYQLFKGGNYTATCSEQMLPYEFFDLANYQINAKFPNKIVERKTLTLDGVMVSGYQVFNLNGDIESLVVLNTSTCVKEKGLFKAALYCLFNHANAYKAARIYSAHINKNYTAMNTESFFIIERVSKEVLGMLPHVFKANKEILTTTPVNELTRKEKFLAEDVLPKPFKVDLKAFLREKPNCKMKNVPSYLLNDKQLIVHHSHITNTTFFDIDGIHRDIQSLCDFSGDIYMLDFESTQFVLPEFDNVKPYDQVGFQYSLHKLSSGKLTQTEFLEMNIDPRELLAKQLIKDTGTEGAILVFNASFERRIIKELAKQYPHLETALMLIVERIVDLHPLFKAYYYNPKMKGSWSLKSLLPAILGYDPYKALNGTCNGEDAANIYHKVKSGYINQAQAEKELSQYCTVDTYALYQLLEFVLNSFASQPKLRA